MSDALQFEYISLCISTNFTLNRLSIPHLYVFSENKLY